MFQIHVFFFLGKFYYILWLTLIPLRYNVSAKSNMIFFVEVHFKSWLLLSYTETVKGMPSTETFS